jgi:tryptophan-rich sensory protein
VSQRRPLLIFLGLTVAATGLGSVATASSVKTWFKTPDQPEWKPPDWLFGPVWTVLYILIALAGWRVWQQRDEPGKRETADRTIGLWGAQLGLDLAWSVVFFGMRRIGLSLPVIGALWASILATAISAGSVAKQATLLLAPCFAWTTFATLLNIEVRRRNRNR